MTAWNHGKSQCPSLEDLSVFADDQTDPDILEHLDDCETCRRTADDFIQIDNLVGEVSRPSPDLAKKILLACHQEQNRHAAALLQDSPRSVRRWMPALRAAAAVVLIAGVLSVWFSQAPAKKTAAAMTAKVPTADSTSVARNTLPSEADEAPHPLLARAVQEPEATSSDTEAFSLADLKAIKGRIPSQKLRTVSSNACPASISQSNVEPVTMARLTAHTWLVEDLDDAAEQLNRLCAAHPCRIVWNNADDPTMRTARVLASDTTIKDLADALYDTKWHLLSPQQPQPHSNTLRLTGDEVIYTVKLVR